MSRFTLHWYCW